MIEPLVIEVLAPLLVPSGLARGRPWPQARADYYRLLVLLDGLSDRFRHRITLYILDPLSGQWMFKVIRHRIRRFPTFLIAGKERYTGWDLEQLSARVERHLSQTHTVHGG